VLDSVRDKIDYDVQPNDWAGLCMFKHSKFGFILFKLNNLLSWEVRERGREREVSEGVGWGGEVAGGENFR